MAQEMPLTIPTSTITLYKTYTEVTELRRIAQELGCNSTTLMVFSIILKFIRHTIAAKRVFLARNPPKARDEIVYDFEHLFTPAEEPWWDVPGFCQ